MVRNLSGGRPTTLAALSNRFAIRSEPEWRPHRDRHRGKDPTEQVLQKEFPWCGTFLVVAPPLLQRFPIALPSSQLRQLRLLIRGERLVRGNVDRYALVRFGGIFRRVGILHHREQRFRTSHLRPHVRLLDRKSVV